MKRMLIIVLVLTLVGLWVRPSMAQTITHTAWPRRLSRLSFRHHDG